jgi:hypothetical protein
MTNISQALEYFYREEILDFEEECRQHLQFGLIQQLEQEIDVPMFESEYDAQWIQEIEGK